MTKLQDAPGVERELSPRADHGEHSYRGSGKLDAGADGIGDYGRRTPR